MQKSKKLVSIFILASFLAICMPKQFAEAKSLSKWKQQAVETSRRMSYIKSQLRHTKAKERTAAAQLAISERRLQSTQVALRDVRSQLRRTRNKLVTTRAELDKIEARLEERNELLAERLSDTYKHGSVSYASVLLGAANIQDLLSRSYIIRKVLQTDVDLVNEIKEDKKAVEEHKAMLEEQERERAVLENEQTALTQRAYENKQERQHVLNRIESDRAEYEAALAGLERDNRRIESMIRSMQRTPQGRKRYSQAWKGGFIRPVNGRVTSDFGMRFHPIVKQYRMHTGVDLAAPLGTVIKAAAGGEIIYTGPGGANGTIVIIDHGGGVSTLYGHCSSVLTRVGKKVSQGEAIARVGSTGWSTGPHLHFEKRINGSPVYPF